MPRDFYRFGTGNKTALAKDIPRQVPVYYRDDFLAKNPPCHLALNARTIISITILIIISSFTSINITSLVINYVFFSS